MECVYFLHDSVLLFQQMPVILLDYMYKSVIQDLPNKIRLASHHIIGDIEMKVPL